MSKTSERSAARLAAVQALYQMDVSGKGVIDAFAEFETFWIGKEVEGITLPQAESEFFRSIISGVVKEQRTIDLKVDAVLEASWPLKRIELVLRAILRAGAWEMMFRKDVPALVVISEYVDVAHAFYEDDEPGLVNAVLDSIGSEVRTAEMEKARERRATKK
ncbi:transcription antitermination factor NusB [Microvirga sp. W0021]|uniref:Transcription antitermination protein NusB n=1 Tax=Hohaiivirga grylli TaxID=3133970 RepID=A0ABV0BLE0_9HYPH